MSTPGTKPRPHRRRHGDTRGDARHRKTRANLPPILLRDLIPERGGILLVGLCSIAPVARRGHFFLGAFGQRVWAKLERAGLLQRCDADDDEVWAVAGNGVTDIVSRAPKSQRDLKREEIAAGVEVLRKKVRKWAPRAIVFAFRNAAEAALGRRDLAPGELPAFEGVKAVLLTGPMAKPADA